MQPAAYADALLLGCAAVWDVMALLGPAPSRWSPVSYVLVGVGVAVGCLGVLLHLLGAGRPGRSRPAEPPGPARPAGVRLETGGAGLRLFALGLALGAWLLRGHPEVPADPPLVVAEALAAVLLVGTLLAGPYGIRHYARLRDDDRRNRDGHEQEGHVRQSRDAPRR